MTVQEAIKRLRQETCPATYMPDFDKEKCLKTIEQELEALTILKNHITPIYATKIKAGGEISYSLDLYVEDLFGKESQSLTIKLNEEEFNKMIATSFVQTLEMRHHTDE